MPHIEPIAAAHSIDENDFSRNSSSSGHDDYSDDHLYLQNDVNNNVYVENDESIYQEISLSNNHFYVQRQVVLEHVGNSGKRSNEMNEIERNVTEMHRERMNNPQHDEDLGRSSSDSTKSIKSVTSEDNNNIKFNDSGTDNESQSHRQHRLNQNTRENNPGENLPIAIPVDDSITYAVVTVSIYMM